MSLLLAAIPTNIVSLAGGRSEASGFSSPQTAQITFNSDGTISGLETGTDKWYALAPLVAVGADYEIYVTRTAGTLPTGTMDTWLALSSNRSWSITQSGVGGGEITAAILVKIRALGGSVVAEGTYDFKVEVFL